MKPPDTCSPSDDATPRVLSRTSVGHVALCGCGHLHLTLQYLTLRFEPEAFRELAALLQFAQRRLDSDAWAAANAAADAGPCRPVH